MTDDEAAEIVDEMLHAGGGPGQVLFDDADIRLVPLAEIRPTPDAENPNKMDAHEYAALRDLIKAGKFNQPLLLAPRADDTYRYTCVDGEHRRRALAELGYAEAPAVVRLMDDDEVRALRVGMNRARGRLDLTVARGVVTDLAAEGWAPAVIGALTAFGVEELADLAAPSGPTAAEMLAEAAGASTPEAPATAAKPFVLEVAFADKKRYQLVRRKLKKAAGKTGDLGLGLLRVLGEEEG